MKKIEIFLPGRIPSKKNSMVHIVRNGAMVKFPSKQYQKREKETLVFLGEQTFPKIKANKVEIGYNFIRPDRRKADISNKIESVNDMLVKYGFMEDDAREFLEISYARTKGKDTENPGVELEILYDREEGYVHPAMDKESTSAKGTLFEQISNE